MIAVIDYGMGNLKSVEKALLKVGAEVVVTQNRDVIVNSKGIVLPGVGAFRDCISNLERLDLLELIKGEIAKGKPYLGICLGLQILFTESEEFGLCKGMSILEGKVKRFNFDGPVIDSQGTRRLKIPHMGWNIVNFVRKPPICSDIPDQSYFYFVHSYYVVPQDHG
ncbi:MAG: imidazole glycerol phosphate synthase subunit HisH, partial [Thermodesulfovibrionales bacterium]|nr:imidazole glycerol phosphate synthase subunit HisH [Thermodesulfovibrionales bacterium]